MVTSLSTAIATGCEMLDETLWRQLEEGFWDRCRSLSTALPPSPRLVETVKTLDLAPHQVGLAFAPTPAPDGTQTVSGDVTAFIEGRGAFRCASDIGPVSALVCACRIIRLHLDTRPSATVVPANPLKGIQPFVWAEGAAHGRIRVSGPLFMPEHGIWETAVWVGDRGPFFAASDGPVSSVTNATRTLELTVARLAHGEI